MIYRYFIDSIEYELERMRCAWNPVHDTRCRRRRRRHRGRIAIIHKVIIAAGHRTTSSQIILIIVITGQWIHLGVVDGREGGVDDQNGCAHLEIEVKSNS